MLWVEPGGLVIELRKATTRGRSQETWLESRHSFSFGGYQDPERMGFRSLRVLNEDWVAPGRGFETHAHRDMEILTVPVAGRVAHRDSEGHIAELNEERIQLMSAGRGIAHSEMNPSSEETLRMLQIWIEPDQKGLAPSYQERSLSEAEGDSVLLVSPDGRGRSLSIHQDVFIHRLLLSEGQTHQARVETGRALWLQVIRGALDLDGTRLESGDAAVVSGEPVLPLSAKTRVEALLFDLG